MLKIPNTIRKIANFFESFPEIGPRQALRLAFYVARSAKDLIIQIAKEVPKIKQCPNCFYFFDDDNELCNICRDSKRFKEIIKKNEVKEIILSFPITLEGKITAKEVREELSSFNLKFFEPKIGLPKGGEIEFVDPETLKEAFKF
jgi:recombinational DNA repair protein RecR